MRKLALNLPSMAMAAGLACAVVFPPSALAGPGGYSGKEESSYGGSIAELEIIKRQERVRQALELEAEGDELFARKDYEGAITKYQQALALLPMGSINQADRERIISKYARAAVLHADELGKRGEFEKAKALLNNVLSENMDPDYKPARVLLEQLDDPDRYNPAMSPRHYANTEEVRRLFRLGIGYFDLGDFRQAEDQFNRILAIDPTNTAARRQMEKTEREISNYNMAARDHTRLKMLNEVDNLWVTSVPGLAKIPELTEGPVGDPSSAPVTFKLNNIIIDRLQFSDASIDEVVQYLGRKSQEADNTEADPNRKGVNFILQGSEGARPINLDMRNVKLLDAVKSICNNAGMRYDIQSNAVVILPATAGGQAGSMTTRSFVVPPDFLTRGAAGGGASGADAAAPADPFAGGAEASTGPRLVTRPTAQKVLEDNGIIFPPGSSAAFSSGRLTVRNTYEMLDAIEALVEQMKGSASKQVYITTKFVEVTQRNTDELGFDWLVGAFNVGSEGVFASGGTAGNAGPINAADFPVISPGGTPTGSNPITRGLRFGSDAVTRNAIDSLISGGAAVEGVSSVSPGIFALAGVFTDPQFQMVMRALSQKKGVDLMTAPSVIVRSGQRSKVEVIREFPWPTEFDPPQIPQTFGGGGTLFGGANTQGNSFPVTPTTPNSFQFKNTGVTMEVEATVAEDNYSIDLNLAPEVVEFEGFVNYGSPIQTTGTNALGQPQPVVLTENKILQPVFATRKLTTQVLIWDRQTVGIGGLIREDVQAVEDKVPFLSSVPLVGRFFKTKTEEHFKKNLMIYVTGVLMDPSGTPIHSFDVPSSSAPPPPEPISLFPEPAPVVISK